MNAVETQRARRGQVSARACTDAISTDASTEKDVFVQRVAGTFVVRVALVAIGFLTSIATARLLGPDGRGIYGAAIVLVTLASQFGNLGLHASNTYCVSIQRSLLPKLVSNSILVSLAAGTLISVSVGLLFRAHASWAPVNRGVLTFVLLLIPLTLEGLLLQNLLLGIQEIKWYNASEVAGKACFLLLCGGLLFFVRHWRPEHAMALALVSVVLALSTAAGRLMKIVGRLPWPDLALLRKQSGYGLKSYLVCLAGYAVLKSDVLLVKYMAGSTATGYYSLASSMTDFVYMFPVVVGMILFPTLTGTANLYQRWNRARKTMAAVAVIMAGVSTCAAFAAKPAVALIYGKNFLPAVPPFLILCVAIVFYSANTVLSIYFSSCGLPWFSVWVWPAAALLNIALNLYAIPNWGIVGAAMSSLVTYSALFVAQYAYASRMPLSSSLPSLGLMVEPRQPAISE